MTAIRAHPRLCGALCTLLVLAAVVVTMLPQLRPPLTHRGARELWGQQGLRHYEMDVEAHADHIALHLTIEVRDEGLVRGVNMHTGASLTADDLAPYLIWLPIEHLFDWIELQRYSGSGTSWQREVANLAPAVAQQLRWCLVRPMQASYDPQLGYPATVQFRHNVCSPQKALKVQIHVTPLPN
jgi:hypothetical protein